MSHKKPKDLKAEPAKLIVAGVLAVVAAYIFVSLAIDRGNWLYYMLSIASAYFAIKHIWYGIRGLKRSV